MSRVRARHEVGRIRRRPCSKTVSIEQPGEHCKLSTLRPAIGLGLSAEARAPKRECQNESAEIKKMRACKIIY